ncbi:MAG: DUF5063 domain-containing protein [Bacteroidales bacterium]
MEFGNDDTYLTIASDDTGEIVTSPASIAENITDVYQDMKDFIMLYQKGTHAAKENAVAECRRLFETHWGSRLVNALRALHHVVYTENPPEEYYDDEN